MKHALIAAVFAVSPAFAQVPTFKSDGLLVRLYETQCAGVVAALLKDEFVPIFRTAAVTVNGRELPACWALQGDEVWIVDADGDSGPLPAAGFRAVKWL